MAAEPGQAGCQLESPCLHRGSTAPSPRYRSLQPSVYIFEKRYYNMKPVWPRGWRTVDVHARRVCVALLIAVSPLAGQARLRARQLGVVPGMLPPGLRDAITDVRGVRVGHATVILGDSVRTGVTAILPHGGNLFLDRVPAAIHVGNGCGKLLGTTQVTELGELETPILLTCPLCVWKVADALVGLLLAQPGMEHVRSLNPVVGETNDGYLLNAIRSRPISEQDVRRPCRRRTQERSTKAQSAPG